MAQNVAITPDIQWVINPALNPEGDLILVFGIRGRLTDQDALSGVLNALYDIHLPLLSVENLDEK